MTTYIAYRLSSSMSGTFEVFLGRDTHRARFLLSRLLGDVILRPDAQGVVAEVRGNLALLLKDVPSIGAGSPFLTQPSTVIDRRTVA